MWKEASVDVEIAGLEGLQRGEALVVRVGRGPATARMQGGLFPNNKVAVIWPSAGREVWSDAGPPS